MSAKRKPKAPACTPQNWKEADALVGKYGEWSAKLTAIEGRCAVAVGRLSQRYQEKANPIRARLDEILEGVALYAEANRKTLTEDGKTKTVQMTNGCIGWRLDPPSIAFKSGLKAGDIVAAVRALIGRLTEDKDKARRDLRVTALTFLRPKVEIDKASMLKHKELAAEVEGVRVIEDQEQFFLDPTKTELPEPK